MRECLSDEGVGIGHLVLILGCAGGRVTDAAIILPFGSPSSPTEGLKIAVFPGKRHQTRHLDFAFFGSPETAAC